MWVFRSEQLVEKLGIVLLLSEYELKTVLRHADCLSHVLYSKEPNRFTLLSLFLLKLFAE